MGVFSEQQDKIKNEDKKSLYDKVAEKLSVRADQIVPKEAPIKALFYGGDGVGKSGTALELLDMINIEEGECVLMVDLEAGNLPSIAAYHQDRLKDLILWPDPVTYKEIQRPDGTPEIVVDYLETMSQIKAAALWAMKNKEKENIKAIVVDGLSTLLKFAEWQMKIDKNVDAGGGVAQRYWVIRNQAFIEMIQIYKTVPLDTIFVGNINFEIDPNDKDVSKIYRDVNDLVFQKVKFTVEETPDGLIQFWAKIEKSKQNIKSRGKRIKYAEVDLKNEESDYWWDARVVIDALRPDPRAKNRAKELRKMGESTEALRNDGDSF